MNNMIAAPLVISAGAIPGALSRYYLMVSVSRRLGIGFPYGTLTVNLSGALLMGFVATLVLGRLISPALQLLLTTGFLGSYTTFSTYALDTVYLSQSRGRIFGLCYWVGSAVGGALSLEVGIGLARWLM